MSVEVRRRVQRAWLLRWSVSDGSMSGSGVRGGTLSGCGVGGGRLNGWVCVCECGVRRAWWWWWVSWQRAPPVYSEHIIQGDPQGDHHHPSISYSFVILPTTVLLTQSRCSHEIVGKG